MSPLRRFADGRASPLLIASLLLFTLSFLAWLFGAPQPRATPATLGAVIPVSSIEAAFVEDTVREALRVASPVVVVYADHLSDGTPEDLSYIAALRAALAAEKGLVWVPVAWFSGRTSRFWVRYLRWAGFPFVDTEYVMWLDADEVLDAPRFRAWWVSGGGLPATGKDTVKLANFVYFREARFQSEQLEDSVVVCKRAALSSGDRFFGDADKEREMFFDGLRGSRMAAALDGAPMVHHFSWVRSKAQMLQKVRAWGHRDDARDWVKEVEAEFARPFRGVDFVHGHTYRTLATPWIDELRRARGGGWAAHGPVN